MTLQPVDAAAIVAAVVVVVAVATAILRRSLIAAAAAVAEASLGLGMLAGVHGRADLVAVVVGAGIALVAVICGTAVAVHRRRGSDHVDELRELQG
ncbi:MAG TPA: hypothetical protein VGF99_02450 [Myxococcota bacterium]